jgi:hypothetical protein
MISFSLTISRTEVFSEVFSPASFSVNVFRFRLLRAISLQNSGLCLTPKRPSPPSFPIFTNSAHFISSARPKYKCHLALHAEQVALSSPAHWSLCPITVLSEQRGQKGKHFETSSFTLPSPKKSFKVIAQCICSLSPTQTRAGRLGKESTKPKYRIPSLHR